MIPAAITANVNKYAIFLHVKRSDSALIPRLIQFFSFLQCFREIRHRIEFWKAVEYSSSYNVNHTACVYKDRNNRIMVFQANIADNCHSILLEDYIKNTQATIEASIHYDLPIVNKDKMLEKIKFYTENFTYSLWSAIGSYKWMPWCKTRKTQTYCTALILRLYERVCTFGGYSLEFKDYFIPTKLIKVYQNNKRIMPFRIRLAVERLMIHNRSTLQLITLKNTYV